LALVLKYPEHNGRIDGADPWSMRQTGIYQSYDTTNRTSVCVLLNPKENTAAENRMKKVFDAEDGLSDANGQPPLLGLIVLSTYLNNWRTYMAYYEREELRMVGSMVTLQSNRS
jgi:hypothetical protein